MRNTRKHIARVVPASVHGNTTDIILPQQRAPDRATLHAETHDQALPPYTPTHQSITGRHQRTQASSPFLSLSLPLFCLSIVQARPRHHLGSIQLRAFPFPLSLPHPLFHIRRGSCAIIQPPYTPHSPNQALHISSAASAPPFQVKPTSHQKAVGLPVANKNTILSSAGAPAVWGKILKLRVGQYVL